MNCRWSGLRRGDHEFVNRIGAAAAAADHHPEITLLYSYVNINLASHDAGGKTPRDVDLARQISAIASEFGLEMQRDVAGSGRHSS